MIHKEYGLFSNLKYIILEGYKSDKVLMVMTLLGFLVSPFIHYLWSFVTKYVIDTVLYTYSITDLLIVIIMGTIAFLVVNILSILIETEKSWRPVAMRFGFLVKRNRKAMSIRYEFLENPAVLDCNYKSMNAAANNNDGIEGLMRKFMEFVSLISVVIVGLIILGNLNIVIMVIMTILTIFNFVIKDKTNELCKKNIWDPMTNVWRKVEYMNNITSDFSYAKDIRMYGLKDYILNRFRKVNSQVFESHKKNKNYWLVANEVGNLMWILAQIILYAWLVYGVIYESMPIGDFTLYLASSSTFFTYTTYLFGSVGDMLKLSRSVDDFRSFMDIEELMGVQDEEKGIDIVKAECYEIVFENVSFKYPGADRYALKNINLKIKYGERLAVVGINGAGKTTLINLLLRLYEPTEGRILLNNVDIQKLDKKQYYKIFAPVFQTVNLFAFPLYLNVSMKDERNTNKDKVRSVVNQAGLDEKIQKLTKGIDTEILKVIYDDGVDLSGGEKQKLALARALYKNGEIMILDEPTAALDAVAESKLYENFDKLIGGKSAIYVSHRLSSTKFCSKIIVMQDGGIVESGSHEELIKSGGMYAEMFNLQAQYYVDGKDVRQEAKVNV